MTRDVSDRVPGKWSNHIQKKRAGGASDKWVEERYEQAKEWARSWAEENCSSLRPGVQEQVQLCLRLLDYPILRASAMDRLLWIRKQIDNHDPSEKPTGND